MACNLVAILTGKLPETHTDVLKTQHGRNAAATMLKAQGMTAVILNDGLTVYRQGWTLRVDRNGRLAGLGNPPSNWQEFIPSSLPLPELSMNAATDCLDFSHVAYRKVAARDHTALVVSGKPPITLRFFRNGTVKAEADEGEFAQAKAAIEALKTKIGIAIPIQWKGQPEQHRHDTLALVNHAHRS